jgi:hypothetical protein
MTEIREMSLDDVDLQNLLLDRIAEARRRKTSGSIEEVDLP